MVLENLMDSGIPIQNGTATNLQTLWRRKGMGASPPEPTPSLPRTPPALPAQPAPPGDNAAAQISEIGGVLPRYVYIHTPLPNP